MKTVMKLTFLLLLLTLGGCKTKEKVTESIKETAQARNSELTKATVQTDLSEKREEQSERNWTQWSDSIVEKFHERIVTDSSGKELLHETEHSKDHYAGKSQGKTTLAEKREEQRQDKNTSVSKEQKDSVYNGGMLQEVTVVKSQSWTWLWYVGLGGFLAIVVAIKIFEFRK